MSASRSAAGVTVFDGRIFVSGGHDGLQIFNTVSFTVKHTVECTLCVICVICVYYVYILCVYSVYSVYTLCTLCRRKRVSG